MRIPFIIGNWKLNPGRAAATVLASAVVEGAGAGEVAVEIGIAPPYLHVPSVSGIVAGSNVALGAQDASEYDAGAYTGEVSARMLVEYGCSFTILGHSERRHLFGESSARIGAKVAAAHAAGLTPVLCVGETLSERQADATLDIVRQQLDAVFAEMVPSAFDAVVVAYEPVWAIGTGETATPDQAQEVHAAIRGYVEAFGARADRTRILYGGSVKPGNAKDLFSMPDIDGGLIGGASLKAEDFLAIVEAAKALSG